MKTKNLLIPLLAGALVLSLGGLHASHEERLRLEENCAELHASASSLRATLGSLRTTLLAEQSSVARLRMTIGELEEFRAHDAALIERLGLRLRNTLSLTTIHSLTLLDTLIVTPPSRDTLARVTTGGVQPNPQPHTTPSDKPSPRHPADSLGVGGVLAPEGLHWRDSWIELHIEPEELGARLELTSRDTLHQVVHRIPHRWWIFSWGTKAIRQEIRNTNPHSRLVWAEYIELER